MEITIKQASNKACVAPKAQNSPVSEASASGSSTYMCTNNTRHDIIASKLQEGTFGQRSLCQKSGS